MELSKLVVDILKLGLTGFGFLLLFMLYRAITKATDAILKSPRIPAETQRTVLRSLSTFAVLITVFFAIVAGLNVWTILRPHQVDLIIHPSGLEPSQLPIFMRGPARIDLNSNQAVSFVVEDKESLNADITPIMNLLRRQIAINTEQQRLTVTSHTKKEIGYDEPR